MDQVLQVPRVYKPAGAHTGLIQFSATVSTTDATTTKIASIPLAEGECIKINASLLGFQDDLSDASATDVEVVAVRAAAGNVTIKGTSGNRIVESDSNTNFTVTADTTNQNVDINVVGVASQNWKWRVFGTYFREK
ncbi:MAG: hypothetical protein E6Q97_21450 [Desulfurellales bacterium]|nr:MAG: hypothetical protein E6Q97_21450 [Desulfurellales bacterium]